MITGFGHVGISTSSIQRLLPFYVDLLGCTVMGEFVWEVGTTRIDKVVGLSGSSAKSVMVRFSDGVLIEIFEYKTPVPKPKMPDHPVHDHGITYFCLLVDDLESEYRRLIKKGVPFNTEPQDFVSVKVTYCRDPDGNIIELMERAKGYPNPIVGVIATGDAPPKR